jgi:hypothetical protein
MKEKGNINAIAIVTVRPGMAPTTMPNKTPDKMATKVKG